MQFLFAGGCVGLIDKTTCALWDWTMCTQPTLSTTLTSSSRVGFRSSTNKTLNPYNFCTHYSNKKILSCIGTLCHLLLKIMKTILLLLIDTLNTQNDGFASPTLRKMDVFQLFILIRHLYLIGVVLGENQHYNRRMP